MPYSELTSVAAAWPTRPTRWGLWALGHDIIAKIICNRGIGYIMESSTDENHQVTIRPRSRHPQPTMWSRLCHRSRQARVQAGREATLLLVQGLPGSHLQN